MKKLVGVLMLILIVSTGVVFAGGQQEQKDDGKFVVGVSWDEKSIPLIQAWEDYMIVEAEANGPGNGLDFEFIINVADLDPTRQAANIEDLIQQDVDVILARAKDGAAIGSSIRAAHDAGIPFIVFDRKSLTEEQGDAYVGGDGYSQGRSTAEALASMLKDKGITGQCIEVMGDLKDNNAVLRSQAVNEVAKETGAFEIVTQVPTEWDPQKFLSGITNALQAYPEADCIYLASDFAWSAVQAALETHGRYKKVGEEGHIIMASCDLFPDALVAMEGGYLDISTTWDAYLHAKALVEVLIAIGTGADLDYGEDGYLVPGRLVLPETLGAMDNIWSRDYADWTNSK
ncbi:MAG: sugar ABC transporter substrate-binding protein [Spirochaetales bacterium]|nr:sugar ABC transporter substrate-binding protein [Spirochaetales bacterium]